MTFTATLVCSLVGLALMFSLTRNQYGWMSKVLEDGDTIPIDENSTLKTVTVLLAGTGITVLNLWVLRRSSGAVSSITAIILLLGVALALWSFFFG